MCLVAAVVLVGAQVSLRLLGLISAVVVGGVAGCCCLASSLLGASILLLSSSVVLHVLVSIGSTKSSSVSRLLCPLCLALLVELSTQPCPSQQAVSVAQEELIGVTPLPSHRALGGMVWLKALQADHLVEHRDDSPLLRFIALAVKERHDIARHELEVLQVYLVGIRLLT